MCLSRPKRKKKPSHITQVSTTFMLFHVDLLLAFGGKQRLIFINKAFRALDGRIAVDEWRRCWRCFVGMVTWTTCRCKICRKFGGGRSVNQPLGSTQLGPIVTIAPPE